MHRIDDAEAPAGHSTRVTIKDVARVAGVSAAAVSLAHNHPERLGRQTVALILKVAGELGYTPLALARELSLRRRAL